MDAKNIQSGRGPRSDSELLKWDNEINTFDDDYEGKLLAFRRVCSRQSDVNCFISYCLAVPETAYGYELKRPFFGFPRISRAGRAFAKMDSQETIKRGGPGGGAGMWFGPRLGRVQKRASSTKEHI